MKFDFKAAINNLMTKSGLTSLYKKYLSKEEDDDEEDDDEEEQQDDKATKQTDQSIEEDESQGELYVGDEDFKELTLNTQLNDQPTDPDIGEQTQTKIKTEIQKAISKKHQKEKKSEEEEKEDEFDGNFTKTSTKARIKEEIMGDATFKTEIGGKSSDVTEESDEDEDVEEEEEEAENDPEKEKKKKVKKIIIQSVVGGAILFLIISEYFFPDESKEPTTTIQKADKQKSIKPTQQMAKDKSQGPSTQPSKPEAQETQTATAPVPESSDVISPEAQEENQKEEKNADLNKSDEEFFQDILEEGDTGDKTAQDSSPSKKIPKQKDQGNQEQMEDEDLGLDLGFDSDQNQDQMANKPLQIPKPITPPQVQEGMEKTRPTMGGQLDSFQNILKNVKIDDSTTFQNAVTGEGIAEQLNLEELGIDKEQIRDFSTPPNYEIIGRGLIYNCASKHWACVDKIEYYHCKGHEIWSKNKGEDPKCIISDVFATNEYCYEAQSLKIHNIKIPSECKN